MTFRSSGMSFEVLKVLIKFLFSGSPGAIYGHFTQLNSSNFIIKKKP